MKTIYHIVWKELLQWRRDRRMVVLSFLAPVLQLALLGYAATTDIKNIPLVVYDQDRSSTSREFVDQFVTSGHFVLEGSVTSPQEIDHAVEHGRVWMAIVIPTDFSSNILSRRTAQVQVIVDGSDANTATISLGYTSQIVARYARTIAMEVQERNPQMVKPARLDPAIRVWYNPELKSRNFMVPGVLAMVLMIITMTLTSLGVVREKEIGTLEQLMVTPIRPYQLIVGKLLPFVLIAVVDIALVLTVTTLWFEVPLRGSLLLLLGLSGLFILTTLGLGLFVSTVSNTQQQAMMTAQFFFFMPFIFLSGFVFPIENMPAAIQYVTYLIPLRYFIVIIRGIFLKGVGIAELWPQALALFLIGSAILTLSVVRFRKRLG